ncbi:hypothetical protein L4C33_11645 [Vibrio makurazakiensis]|uniref:hypothetical protein n=1 Tax=Vibrio makurazakiensis TaxID=2910250 RepID=UPI003D1500D6
MRYFYDFLTYTDAYKPQPLSCHAELKYEYLQFQYALSDRSKKRVQRYLLNEPCFLHDFGAISDVDSVIAFSFGDSSRVNRQLSEIVNQLYLLDPTKNLYIQQEIASHLPMLPIASIECDEYQTTYEVALKAAGSAHQGGKNNQYGRKVLVVAQAWHASRCIKTCQELGLDVAGLRVVNDFPAADPQPWVRNPINWVIKESHRDVATGYEISKLYSLS